MWTGKFGLARRRLWFSWREALTGISCIILWSSGDKYTNCFHYIFVHTSASPQQFLHTHIRELTFHLPGEQRQWDEPDHEKPHPIKMLKSKYLNCSWALICMLEKLLNFVSLPTDFVVQVLSRKKASCEALPQDSPVFPPVHVASIRRHLQDETTATPEV